MADRTNEKKDDFEAETKKTNGNMEVVKRRAAERFARARETAMDAKFRPAKLETVWTEEGLECATENLIFGEFDGDAKDDDEKLPEGVREEDIVSLPPLWRPTNEPAEYIPENELK